MLLPSQVKYVVFSGGGVRGYSYVGVVKELVRCGVDIGNLAGMGGTSIGALLAALVCAGWTAGELEAELMSVHAKEKIDLSLTCLINKFGLDTGETLALYINSLLQRSTRCAHLTFADLWHTRGKQLVLIACDLKHNEELVFSHATTPDLAVAAAVQMSMAVPGLFAPVPWNERLVVDGGLKNNFPLAHFPAESTLGVRVTWPTARSLRSVDQVLARSIYCILTDAEEVQWQQLGEVRRANTIHVEVGDLATIELHLTPAQKRSIMAKGEVAVRKAMADPFTALYTQVVATLTRACGVASQKLFDA
jgi:NTE family protein